MKLYKIQDYQLGQKGDPGIPGKDGKDGRDGLPGKNGKDGLPGAKGDKPDHYWNGTKLAFENPDGTWGEEVDLKGETGKAGEQGWSTGPIPQETVQYKQITAADYTISGRGLVKGTNIFGYAGTSNAEIQLPPAITSDRLITIVNESDYAILMGAGGDYLAVDAGDNTLVINPEGDGLLTDPTGTIDVRDIAAGESRTYYWNGSKYWSY